MLVATSRPPLPSARARRLFAEATADAEWRRIHAVADLVAPILERVILSSFEDALAEVDERAMIRAIRSKDVDAVLDAIPYATLESRLLRMVDVLRAAHLGGAHVAGQHLQLLPPEPKTAAESDPYIAVMSMLGPKIKGYFDLLNPKALEWAETESTKLIKDDISEASKAQIRARLVEEFQEGYGPAALARKILPLVPLTEVHAAAAENYYSGLLDKGIDPERAEKLFIAYAMRLRRYRARVIARTETIAASNAGQAAMWQLAADQGYLDRSKTLRRWIVTPDDRLCPTCKLMKGQEVPVDKPFKSPGGYEVANPPLHPACRCGQGLVNPTAPPLPKQEPQPPPPPPKALPGSPEWLDELTEVAMSLGGIHEKHVYVDRDGNKWLFKPDEVAGLAERATYRIMAELGLPAPEVYLVTKGGKTGTIQRMFDDVDAPVKADGLHTLTRQQLEDIQTHQVLDWLVAQHDSNEGAFLINKSGRVYAVDKGQAVKFLGSDKLDWTYNPNPLPVVYNKMFEAHIAGRITLDRSAVDPILKRVVDLDDKVLKEAFRPYAEYGVRKGWFRTVDELLDKLVARKASIVSDFDDLYRRADAARARRLGQQTPAGAYTRLDDEFARQVREQGWAGRSIMVAGPDFEDAHILAYEIRQGTKRTLVLEGKVREAAEGRVLQAIGTPAAAPRTHPLDTLWTDVLTAVKHAHYHLKPGSPGKDDVLKPDKVQALKTAAEKIVKTTSPANPQDVEDMLSYYSDIIQKLTGKHALDVATASTAQVSDWIKAAYDPNLYVEQYQIPVKAAPIAPDKIQARRERPWQYKRSLQGGEIVATTSREALHGDAGYTLELGGGMTGVYIQHGDANTYSKMGRLTIYREGYQGTAREIADTLDQFKRLGIEARLATKADLELVYLHKQAHAMKLEKDATWTAAVAAAEAEPTVAGKVAMLKEALKKALKLKKADKLEDVPGYDPEPKFDRGWNPASGAKATGPAGRPYWERFDIDRSTFEAEMADYGLAHHLSSRDTYTFLREVLDGNGWALNTEERIRAGVYTGQGMSPEADMRTGGASYFFTRIMPKRAWDSYNLVFDPRLLLRTDLISYDGDMYGRSDPATKERRNVTIAAWKNASRHGGNEAIIKNGVSLVDNLVRVNAGGYRQQIIDLFKQHGITEINGRKVEDVVR